MENEQKTVRWDEVKRKIWLKNTWAKIKWRAAKVGQWMVEHPMETIAAAGATAGVAKKLSGAYKVHAEEVRRDRDFYNPRNGHHSKITRKLRPAEQVEVSRRFNNGEDYDSIFFDMGILK